MTKHSVSHKQMLLILAVLIASGMFSIILFFESRIYPNTFVENIDVGSMNARDALSIVKTKYSPNVSSITLSYPDNEADEISVNPFVLEPQINYQGAIDKAFMRGKSKILILDLVSFFRSFTNKQQIALDVEFNTEPLTDIFTSIESQIKKVPVNPSVKIASNEVTVNRGAEGYKLDREALKLEIKESLLNNRARITIPLTKVDPTITEEVADTLSERAKRLIGKVLIISIEDTTIKKSPQEMVSLLGPHGYDEESLAKFSSEIAGRINRSVENPIFSVTNGKVETFAPPKDGIKLDEKAFASQLMQAMTVLENGEEKETSINPTVIREKAPEFASSAKDYGIIELIGKGTSTFRGSIPSRVHNVALAASRVDGTLVAPNETFSFNKAVGDISLLTGFKQAYVIQNGKTVLGDGGGVCQVSTTLFRAVMNAGLPVNERRSHSYRVGYYEQDAPPGLDATVYSPTTDFKFTNDTEHYILVHTIADTKALRLTFELYGTKDGRTSETTKPVISDVVAPPDDLYVDDPTLPTGKVNQVEHRSVGSKSTFTYTVTKNGQVTYKKVFVSVYQPWQAVYMRGTGPAQ